MKILTIELSEVFCQWLKDPSQINCRISLKSSIQVIKYQQSVMFELVNPSSSDQVHILIQEDNIVLGSLTVTLEWMFGQALNKDLDDWIYVEVPIESIILITKQPAKDIEAKALRVRLTGKFLNTRQQVEKKEEVKKVEESLNVESQPEARKSPRSFEIVIDPPKDDKHIEHRKKPSDTDSLERDPKSPKESTKKPSAEVEKSPKEALKSPVKKYKSKSPQARSPRLSPAASPRAVKEPPKSPKFSSSPKKNQKTPSSPFEFTQKSPKAPEAVISPVKSPRTKSPAGSPAPKPSPQPPILPIASEPLPENPPKQMDDSLSLGSSILSSDDEEKKVEEEVVRQRPTKIALSANSIISPCGYLKNVLRVEFHLKSIMSTLTKLKEDMGGAFLKLIEESTRRDSRSPSRSPSRKLTNSGLRTPLVSQRSLNASVISSFRVEEENIVDVPGTVDVFLDRLSIKNVEILSNCIAGMLAKNTYAAVQTREIEPTKDVIHLQEKATNMIKDSMKATETEFGQEKDNYDIMIKRLKDEITTINTSIESIKKKNQLALYEKNSGEKELTKLKAERAEIKKKYNASVDLDAIKQLKKAADTLEKGRVELEEKLSACATQHKGVFETAAAIQNKYIEEKTSLQTEVKMIAASLENIERENHKIRSEMQGMTGSIYVDDELHKMLVNYQGNSRLHSQSLDSIRTQLTYLRSQKEDLANEAFAQQQKIDAETKRVRSSQNNWNKEIESNSEIISGLNRDFKKLRQEVAYIEDIFSKKQSVDSLFESIYSKAKHNQETKDQLINELSYFSDFVFSLSQTFLQQKRIFEKVKVIVGEKEMEVEAMRTAVLELKHSNPVYFPVPEDNIDQAVADYFNSRDDILIVPFVRETYGVYLYGSKRVMVNIERGRLIVKVGGGFLPIEVFIDNYTDIELDKYDNKVIEASPKMKRFMAKWVGGLNPKTDSPEKIKEGLVKAMEGHKFTQAYGVRDVKPVVKKVSEGFLTPPRAETPIIEEDI